MADDSSKRFYNSVSVSKRRQTLKKKAVDYMGGKCSRCGYDKCIAALQFHHKDPSEKEFGISSNTPSWESVKTELDKCDILCSNCHSEIHYEITTKAFDEKVKELRKIVPATNAKPSLVVLCETCGAECKKYASNKAKHFFCSSQCKKSYKFNSKIEWPEHAELLKMVDKNGYAATGRQFGVSGNAVKRKIKKSTNN